MKKRWFVKIIFHLFDFPIFDPKPIIPLRAIPKKSKKPQSKTQLCHFSFWNLSFRCGRPLKSRKNVKWKHCFWKFGAPLSHLRLFRLIFVSFRFLPFVSFRLKNKWFSKVLLNSLMFFRKTIDFYRLSLKSWSFLWKTNDLSSLLFKFVIFVRAIPICISETLSIHQNDPLVTVGSKSAFAKKG